jgi:hypothetical protein
VTTSGCSTLGVDGAKIKPQPASALCPHPRVYANWHTFTGTTQIKQGETAFQTVKRFRVAEAEKNKAGQRLWEGMKACRQDKAPEPKDPGAEDTSIADLFSGESSSLASQ